MRTPSMPPCPAPAPRYERRGRNSSAVRSLAAILLAELVLDDLAKVIRTDWLGEESVSANLAK